VGKYHEESYSTHPKFVVYIPREELNNLSERLIAVKLER